MKGLTILLLSPFQEDSLGHPLYVGLARSYECSRRTIHLSRGTVDNQLLGSEYTESPDPHGCTSCAE